MNTLHKITTVVDNHKATKSKKYDHVISKTKILDDCPPLPTFKSLKDDDKILPGSSHICLVEVDELWADACYNRIKELNLPKVFDNLEKLGGFSYLTAGILQAFVRPNGRVVLTQGNHRASKVYLTGGKNSYVPILLKVHETSDVDQCILDEAKNFNSDGTARWNLQLPDKFKGGYYADVKDYVDLYNFVKQYKISIAATNEGDYIATHKFESYTELMKAMASDGEPFPNVRDSLSALTRYLPKDTDISGYVTNGLVCFKQIFGKRIQIIFDANPHTSFDDFIKFVFTERKTFNGAGDLTTQEDIIEGSGVIKVKQYFASKFVVLFNEYCLTRKCRVDVKSLKGKIAIPESCDEWSKLTEILTPSMKRLFSTEKM
jgi:hypothetical protein